MVEVGAGWVDDGVGDGDNDALLSGGKKIVLL